MKGLILPDFFSNPDICCSDIFDHFRGHRFYQVNPLFKKMTGEGLCRVYIADTFNFFIVLLIFLKCSFEMAEPHMA